MMDIDLAKPYDKLQKFLWKALSNKGVCITHIQTINYIYDGPTANYKP